MFCKLFEVDTKGVKAGNNQEAVQGKTRSMFDAAVEKAYNGERGLAWMEVYAGEKAVEVTGDKSGLPLAIKCDASTGENCNEKENAYLTKIGSWTDEKKASELGE